VIILAIPSLLSDLILLNFTRKRKFYKNLKEYDYKKDNANVNKQIDIEGQKSTSGRKFCL
jgi:hypothetical protein